VTEKVKESGAHEAARKDALGKAWLAENKAAIDVYNQRIEKQDTLLKPMWFEQ
jgi:hypothetical protein